VPLCGCEQDRLLGLLDPEVRNKIFRRQIPNGNALPRTLHSTRTLRFISKHDRAHVCYTSTNIYQTCLGVGNITPSLPTNSFLGAFAVLRKAAFSFMSSRLSDRMDNSTSTRRDGFSWNYKLVAFINICHENSSLFKIRHKYWALCMTTYATFYNDSDISNSRYKSERVAFPRQHLCSSHVFVFRSRDLQNPSYVTQNPGYLAGVGGSPLGGMINPDNNYYYYYYYLLQLGCYPVAVVILHVYKTWNWLLLNLSREGYMRSM